MGILVNDLQSRDQRQLIITPPRHHVQYSNHIKHHLKPGARLSGTSNGEALRRRGHGGRPPAHALPSRLDCTLQRRRPSDGAGGEEAPEGHHLRVIVNTSRTHAHTSRPESARAWPRSVSVGKSGSRSQQKLARVRSLAKFKRIMGDVTAARFIEVTRAREITQK